VAGSGPHLQYTVQGQGGIHAVQLSLTSRVSHRLVGYAMPGTAPAAGLASLHRPDLMTAALCYNEREYRDTNVTHIPWYHVCMWHVHAQPRLKA
jgi:hypothetical protein